MKRKEYKKPLRWEQVGIIEEHQELGGVSRAEGARWRVRSYSIHGA